MIEINFAFQFRQTQGEVGGERSEKTVYTRSLVTLLETPVHHSCSDPISQKRTQNGTKKKNQ